MYTSRVASWSCNQEKMQWHPTVVVRKAGRDLDCRPCSCQSVGIGAWASGYHSTTPRLTNCALQTWPMMHGLQDAIPIACPIQIAGHEVLTRESQTTSLGLLYNTCKRVARYCLLQLYGEYTGRARSLSMQSRNLPTGVV